MYAIYSFVCFKKNVLLPGVFDAFGKRWSRLVGWVSVGLCPFLCGPTVAITSAVITQ